jgi:hypothetical protein
MKNTLKSLHALDWIIAGAVAFWGLATGDPWWLAVGVASLVLAYINPGARIKTWLERKFLGKTARPVSSEVATREAMADLAQDSNGPAPQMEAADGPPNFARTFLTYGPTTLSTSPHNLLRAENVSTTGKRVLWV